MRKFLGMAVGAVVALAVSAANAQTAEGTIEEIDTTMKTITIDGEKYQMPEAMTAGDDVEALQVGDKVNITYEEEDSGDEESLPLAKSVEKVE